MLNWWKKKKEHDLSWDGAKSYEFGFTLYYMLMIMPVKIDLGHKRSAAIPYNVKNVCDIIWHLKGYSNKGGSIWKYKDETE